MTETWKEIDGYAGYRVSDLGNVETRRVRGGGTFGRMAESWKPLAACVNGEGRRLVIIRNLYGKMRTAHLSVLVLEAFVGLRPDGRFACHKDDNRLNDVLSNLYWGTRQDNANDSAKNGRQIRGSQCSRHSDLTEEAVKTIKEELASGMSGSVVARQHGVSKNIVSRIKCGHTWRHVT